MTAWIRPMFGTDHPVVAMVHVHALPSTPRYDLTGGMQRVVDLAARDLEALQSGGVHAVMFCNEHDRPYTLRADPAVTAAMARVVGELRRELSVPFGIDVLWDPRAALAVAAATEADFVRGIFTGVYESDMGLWQESAGEVARYASRIACGARLLYNINAEFASPLGRRTLVESARSVAFACAPDGLCVSGAITGDPVRDEDLAAVRAAAPAVALFANTGTTADNVLARFSRADGVIVGTHFKVDGVTWNPVDVTRVRTFMAVAGRATQDSSKGR